MYTEPEVLYEIVQETKRLIQLKRGHRLVGGARIGDVVVGHKYVTVKAENGQLLWRELLVTAQDTEVEVQVRRQTDESRAAQQRYDGNLSIINTLECYDNDLKLRRARFDARWVEWGRLEYSHLGDMLEGEAIHLLWARFKANLKYHLEQGLDHVGALELYVESMKESLLQSGRLRGMSRSTNQLSNLIENIEIEQMVQFINAVRWYGVR